MAMGIGPFFDVHYDEGLKVGYKWYDAEKRPVLFPLGFGLSYTTFAYSGLSVIPGDTTFVTFTVKNTGKRAGIETAQVYASLPDAADEPPKRLIGWTKIELAPDESKQVSVPVSRDRLTIYDEDALDKLLRLSIALIREIPEILVLTDRWRILNLGKSEIARYVRRMKFPCLLELVVVRRSDLRTAHFLLAEDTLDDRKHPDSLVQHGPRLLWIAILLGFMPEVERLGGAPQANSSAYYSFILMGD
jgi:hypothetical protein